MTLFILIFYAIYEKKIEKNDNLIPRHNYYEMCKEAVSAIPSHLIYDNNNENKKKKNDFRYLWALQIAHHNLSF